MFFKQTFSREIKKSINTEKEILRQLFYHLSSRAEQMKLNKVLFMCCVCVQNFVGGKNARIRKRSPCLCSNQACSYYKLIYHLGIYKRYLQTYANGQLDILVIKLFTCMQLLHLSTLFLHLLTHLLHKFLLIHG